MKKLNGKELAKEFNELRIREQGKTFLGSELDKLLNKYGFSNSMILALKNSKVFDYVQSGPSKLFSFKSDPLYHQKMEDIISLARSKYSYGRNKKELPELTDEEKAVALLSKKGYQIRVLRGFDEVRFAKENPEMYQKYLVYEDIIK